MFSSAVSLQIHLLISMVASIVRQVCQLNPWNVLTKIQFWDTLSLCARPEIASRRAIECWGDSWANSDECGFESDLLGGLMCWGLKCVKHCMAWCLNGPGRWGGGRRDILRSIQSFHVDFYFTQNAFFLKKGVLITNLAMINLRILVNSMLGVISYSLFVEEDFSWFSQLWFYEFRVAKIKLACRNCSVVPVPISFIGPSTARELPQWFNADNLSFNICFCLCFWSKPPELTARGLQLFIVAASPGPPPPIRPSRSCLSSSLNITPPTTPSLSMTIKY